MLYAILGRDAPDSLEQRLAARPAHLERLQDLLAEGRLILAGPLPAIDGPDPGSAGFQGSLMVEMCIRDRPGIRPVRRGRGKCRAPGAALSLIHI